MRVTQVIQDVWNSTAGPTYSVARLADELCRLGGESVVMALGASPETWPHRASLRLQSGWSERVTGLSVRMAVDIRKLLATSGVIHGHGLWRYANLFPLLADGRSLAKLVYSPRGMLSPWCLQQKSVAKARFWELLQKPALERCHCYHATARLEYEDIRRLGLRCRPVAVVPNGVDLPDLTSRLAARTRKVVFLSRIDPKKGLDILIAAWTVVAREFPDWEVLIAGPLGGKYARFVREMARKLRTPRVTFVGRVVGEAKRRLLSEASLFVLPTYSENFGIVVAEALAHATPVITTTGTPWDEVGERRCGWWIQPDLRQLEDTLRDAMSRPLPALHEMGKRGRVWMERDYAWRRVGEMMHQTYEWLLHDTRRPEWVLTD